MSTEPFFFDRAVLRKQADQEGKGYRQAQPFPHVIIDDFLPETVAARVLEEFPTPDKPSWQRYNEPRQRKLASREESELGPATRQVLGQFNSAAFLEFLEALTGINDLLGDPWFEGGGLHQIEPGGLLKVHVDFNRHARLGLYRRVNALLYLNKDWSADYGGNLELWNANVDKCEQSIEPRFNRLVAFSTSDISYHGHPNPLTAPEGMSRKSLALYYYTVARPNLAIRKPDHSTLFRRRPGEKTPLTLRELGELLCPPIILNTFERMSRRRA